MPSGAYLCKYTTLTQAGAIGSSTFTSSSYATTASNLYDGSANDTTTDYHLLGTNANSNYVCVSAMWDLLANVTVNTLKFTYKSNNDAGIYAGPYAVFYGSTNGTTWTQITTDPTAPNTISWSSRSLAIGNTQYRYWRLDIIDQNIAGDNSGGAYLSDFRLYDGSAAQYVIGSASITISGSSGIASAETFGTGAMVGATLVGTGITSRETSGASLLVQSSGEIYASGIPTAETPGAQMMQFLLSGVGIASAESLGFHTSTLANTFLGAGIPSAESFGRSSSMSSGPVTINGYGIASTETFGSGVLTNATFTIIVGSGIPSAETLGTDVMLLLSTDGNAFINMGNYTSFLSDQALATLAGVDIETITAFRHSVPSWKIKKYYKQVAKAIGCDPNHLLGVICRAERLINGRGVQPFPSSSKFTKTGMNPKH